MSAHRARGGALLFALLAAVALLVLGCSSDVSGTAQPASDASVVDATPRSTAASPTSKSPTTSRGASPTTTKKPKTGDNGGDVKFEVEIGQCVKLGGTTNDAKIDHAACGSKDSNYKVIGKAPTSAQCVSDADSYYYETVNGVEQGALCLDVDWVVGGCMDISGDDPLRIDCTAKTTDGVRVVEILTGTSDVNNCSSPTGFTHDERNFVVCTESL